jgi:hypothetical protein
MKFARWVYAIAGVYGILVTLPLYFTETAIGQLMPPALNHPEYFYGFAGGTLAWQLVFILIARDPLRYRPLMLITLVEKFSFFLAAVVLYTQSRLPVQIMGSATIDLVLGILFCIAYVRTGKAEQT